MRFDSINAPISEMPQRAAQRERCPVCHRPMADSAERGCVAGNCCYRPDDPIEERRIAEHRASFAINKDGT